MKKKALFAIDNFIPTPDRDGGSLRFWNILRLFTELGFQTSFFPAGPRPGLNPEEEIKYRRNLEDCGVQVIPPSSEELWEQTIEKFGSQSDLALLSGGVYLASRFLGHVRRQAPQTQVIFDTVDLSYLTQYRQAKLSNSMALLKRSLDVKRLELKVATLADFTFFVSEREKNILMEEIAELRGFVLPNIHSIHAPRNSFDARKNLLFVGAMQHPPNADAVPYFVREIFPLVQQTLPETCLDLVGSHPPEEILALASENVRVTGYVPDLDEYYESARVTIAPLRFGAGIKGKILESMGRGVPVVTTSIGAEGMGLIPNEDFLLADSKEAFASAVIQLYRDQKLWGKLSQNGLRKIQDNYTWDIIKNRLQNFLTNNRVEI